MLLWSHNFETPQKTKSKIPWSTSPLKREALSHHHHQVPP